MLLLNISEFALRVDARRAPPNETLVRAGSERTSSPWTHIAQQNRSAGERESARRVVLCTPSRRARDLAKRDAAQRGPAGDERHAVLCPRLVNKKRSSNFYIKQTISSPSKIFGLM